MADTGHDYTDILREAKLALYKHMKALSSGECPESQGASHAKTMEEAKAKAKKEADGGYLTVNQAELVRKVVKDFSKIVAEQEASQGGAANLSSHSSEDLRAMLRDVEAG